MSNKEGWLSKLVGSGQLEELTRRIEQLTMQLDDRERQLAERLVQLNEAQAKLQSETNRADAHAAREKDLTQRCAELTQQKLALEASVAAGNTAASRQSKELKVATERFQLATKQAAAFEQRTVSLAAKLKEQEDAAAQARAELATLSSSHADLQRELTEALHAKRQSQETSKGLEASLSQLRAASATELTDVTRRLTEKQQALSVLEREHARSVDGAAALQRDHEKLLEKATLVERERQALATESSIRIAELQGLVKGAHLLLNLSVRGLSAALGPGTALAFRLIPPSELSTLTARLRELRVPAAEGAKELLNRHGLVNISILSHEPLAIHIRPQEPGSESAASWAAGVFGACLAPTPDSPGARSVTPDENGFVAVYG